MGVVPVAEAIDEPFREKDSPDAEAESEIEERESRVRTRGESVTTVPGIDFVVLEDPVEVPDEVVLRTILVVGLGEGVGLPVTIVSTRATGSACATGTPSTFPINTNIVTKTVNKVHFCPRPKSNIRPVRCLRLRPAFIPSVISPSFDIPSITLDDVNSTSRNQVDKTNWLTTVVPSCLRG